MGQNSDGIRLHVPQFQRPHQRRGLLHVGDGEVVEGDKVFGVEGLGHGAPACKIGGRFPFSKIPSRQPLPSAPRELFYDPPDRFHQTIRHKIGHGEAEEEN